MKNRENLCDLNEHDMRKRICEMQNKATLKDGSPVSNRYIARVLKELLDGHSKDTTEDARMRRYKNLKNSSTNQRYLSREAVRKLAEIFGCSLHYLEYGEDEIDNGHNITSPIYNIPDKQWADLASKLSKDDASVENLHFIFCQLPEKDSIEAIKALNTFLSLLKDSSFYSTSSIAIEKRSKLMSTILQNDPFYSKMNIQLSDAIDYINEGDNVNALKKFIEIIINYESQPRTELAALKEKAYRKIEGLMQSWAKFPCDIAEILPMLHDFYISNKRNLDSAAIESAKTIAENYLSNN